MDSEGRAPLCETQSTAAQLFEQGKTARIDGEYDQAIALLSRVIAAEPEHADAHMELGLAYCFTGLFDESVLELQRATEISPGNPEFHLQLGKIRTMLGMYDEGAAAFRMVLTLVGPSDKHYEEAEKQLSYFQ